MSLQVWLPLNGDLRNNGIANIGEPSYQDVTYPDGKIGKCMEGIVGWHLNNEILGNEWSVATWYLSPQAFPSYNQIIFCKNIKGNDDAQIYLSIIGGDRLNLGINNSTQATSAVYTFETNTWYHIVATFNGNVAKLYIDGILKRSTAISNTLVTGRLNISLSSRSINESGTTSGDTGRLSHMNDFRLYDHALSAAEVKEISRGLIVHYPLDSNISDFNNTKNENLFIGTNKNVYTSGGVGSRAKKTMGAGSSGNGTFSITEEANLPVGKYSFNITGNTSGNKDYQQDQIPYKEGEKYTASWWAKGSGTMRSRSWDLARNTEYVVQAKILNSEWTYYTRTFTATAYMETNNCTFQIGITGKSNISICGMKIEKGSVATGYSLNKEDDGYEYENDNIVYDCSGNGYNGTITGTLSTIIDGARYSKCGDFSQSNCYITADGLPAETQSISCWVKTTWATPSGSVYKIPVHDKQSGLAIGFASSNRLLTYVGSSNGGTGSNVLTTNLYNANKWNHIVVIKTGATTRTVYINGQLATATTNNFWGGQINKLFIGGRYYSSAYKDFFDGQISDFRAYATQLSEADILDLYHTSSKIDNTGKLHTYSIVEDSTSTTPKITSQGLTIMNNSADGFIEDSTLSNLSITKTGQLKATELIEI